MRNRFDFLKPVCNYTGALLMVLGAILVVPFFVQAFYFFYGYEEVTFFCYLLPASLALLAGYAIRLKCKQTHINNKDAMLVCVLAWIVLSAIGALPFVIGLELGYLDAYFETVSGFTTTGITMLTGLDYMPRSILIWRSLLQWLGGLGILTFFLIIVGGGNSSHRLFSAESHKIFTKRPAPNLFRTLEILWSIYAIFTLIVFLLLLLTGTGLFDAIAHALTTVSTGGFSPYDASIGHYEQAGYKNYAAIEYIIIFGMILGAINFLIHFRVLTGGVEAFWDNAEIRVWWLILGVGILSVWLDHSLRAGFFQTEGAFRTSLFQATSIATGTGYSTEYIGSKFFPSFSRLVFLTFMVIGGCVGSTTGGIKVMRVIILLKLVIVQLNSTLLGRRATYVLTIDDNAIEKEEISRTCALFFTWILFIVVGAGITAMFAAGLGPIEAASGMFSAMGNIGPCYIPAEEMSNLHPVIKVTYIMGMLAGRLEILPILMLFSRWTWR